MKENMKDYIERKIKDYEADQKLVESDLNQFYRDMRSKYEICPGLPVYIPDLALKEREEHQYLGKHYAQNEAVLYELYELRKKLQEQGVSNHD